MEPVNLEVAQLADARKASEIARDYSASLGFNSNECEEIALVVSELASNLVRHASFGTLRLSTLQNDGRVGIRIESVDSGPGIVDVERAVTDGFSTAGSLGIGLGTVNRLMDDLDVHPRIPRGVHVITQRWLRPKLQQGAAEGLSFGVATRSYKRLPENGDAFILMKWDGNALVGVIDGLGHGPLAQRASQTARRYIEQHFDQPIESLFRGVQRVCRSTRGVVMALARFDMNENKIIVGNIGNIEVRLFGSTQHFTPIVRRGVIGLNAPDPVLVEHPWTPRCVLVMHSDGISTHWSLNEYPDLVQAPPDVIAQKLIHTQAKIEDDATVVVVRNSLFAA